MHQRQTQWFSLGELRESDTTGSCTTYHFSSATTTFSRSRDGWVRLSIALDEEARTAARGPRRSWAIDGEAEAKRVWETTDVDSPQTFTDRRTKRYFVGHGGVEGNVNPHEDTRGVVPITVAGHRFLHSEAGSIEVSRCRDGVLLSLPLEEGVRVYGLGEKTGPLDKRGRSWIMWNCDEPDHTPERDPLYQSIPVAHLFTPQGTKTVFVDSTATIYLDVGEGVSDRLQIEVYDTEFDLYVAENPSLPAAVAAWSDLTGTMTLPPEWALGFQQCRYSYYPEQRVFEVARAMRRARIPCDVIYLDIHYMDGYRVFTWDRGRFPDPKAMNERLRDDGFHLVTIVDPGVKVDPDCPVFADGLEKGVFLQDPTGTTYVGKVWPGDAAFPDFSDRSAREWWAEWHHRLLDNGVDGIWNDMNEPADFTGDEIYRPDYTVPSSLVVRNDGHPTSMARLHNAYANGMNMATRSAFARYRPEERGFVLTRAGYAGVQRHAAVWTGDNSSWWEHIGLMQPMFMNVGLSGVPFVGGDVGGFQFNAGPELYARWIAAACLVPFFRAHSALDTEDHEPWSFGEDVLSIARRFVELRYRLLPYLYTLFEEASCSGTPIMRPLVWEFPDDPRVHNRADCYLAGSAILVAPVKDPGVTERAVYLPAGVWYDVWTGERVVAGDPERPGSGGAIVAAEAPLDRVPMYLRGGSVIPYEAVRQHTGEAGDGVLRLLVVPDADGRAEGTIYGDAGEGFGYRDGAYWRATATYREDNGQLTLAVQHGDGAGETRWHSVRALSVRPGVAAISILDDEATDGLVACPSSGTIDITVR